MVSLVCGHQLGDRVGAPLSLFAVISGIRIWWRPHTRWITKIKFTLVGVACVVLSLFAAYYHLIGPAQRI